MDHDRVRIDTIVIVDPYDDVVVECRTLGEDFTLARAGGRKWGTPWQTLYYGH